ncbi:hypothetical protein EYF80_002857 [Liparis tanakae]|uniref:Uncharacterized protein n=1 Tax=Liparis tanakae TaxID=230148 RepID=A0A4Z2JCS2_9TELE|nr:hypothetical protein EYF80_002857 [Liparis tanakae]
MVLTDEAAVMEPAVGLGCILRSARRKKDKEKQRDYIRARELVGAQEALRLQTQRVSAALRATASPLQLGDVNTCLKQCNGLTGWKGKMNEEEEEERDNERL